MNRTLFFSFLGLLLMGWSFDGVALTFNYDATDLGTLGGHASTAYELNNYGQVTGQSYDSDASVLGFIWTRSAGMRSIGTLFPEFDSYSEGVAINNLGQIAGSSENHAMLWDEINGPKGLTDNKIFRAEGINDFGQVVGYGQDASYIWDILNGSRNLGALGFGATARSINNLGQVVGYSYVEIDSPNNTRHAFIWDEVNGIRDIGTLGGGWSEAMDINDKGVVVGVSETEDGQQHAFIWDKLTGMIDIGSLDENKGVSRAMALNNLNQVVGQSNNRAFYWDFENGMLDLNLLIKNNVEWELLEIAMSINDHGEIAGNGKLRGSHLNGEAINHAFLLSSENRIVPEPSTLVLFTMAMFSLMIKRIC